MIVDTASLTYLTSYSVEHLHINNNVFFILDEMYQCHFVYIRNTATHQQRCFSNEFD